MVDGIIVIIKIKNNVSMRFIQWIKLRVNLMLKIK